MLLLLRNRTIEAELLNITFPGQAQFRAPQRTVSSRHSMTFESTLHSLESVAAY